MAASAESLEALRQEMIALRMQFDSVAPKFATYDMMLHANEPWKKTVEKLLTDQDQKQDAVVASLKDLYEKADSSIREINVKLRDHLPKAGSGGAGPEKKWQMTRLKDLDPSIFSGKEEEWSRWQDEVEDYADAYQTGLRQALEMAADQKVPITEKTFKENGWAREWDEMEPVIKLLKRKTVPKTEARNIVMCAEPNGFEAWRTLALRYQPNGSIRRLQEIAELTALQSTRCKTAAETALIVLEVDRRKRIIEQIGGQLPSNDILVGVLWATMDAGTRTHVSSKIADVSEVTYPELRQAIGVHTNLVSATSRGPTAMDIGAIEDSSPRLPETPATDSGGLVSRMAPPISGPWTRVAGPSTTKVTRSTGTSTHSP